MIRRPPTSTRVRSSAASDVYKRQEDDVPVDAGLLAEERDPRVDHAEEHHCRGAGQGGCDPVDAFAAAYVLIATERIHRVAAALSGADDPYPAVVVIDHGDHRAVHAGHHRRHLETCGVDVDNR